MSDAGGAMTGAEQVLGVINAHEFWFKHWAWLIWLGMWVGGLAAVGFDAFGHKYCGPAGENCRRCLCPAYLLGRRAIFSPVAFATGLWLLPAGTLMGEISGGATVLGDVFRGWSGAGGAGPATLAQTLAYVALVIVPTFLYGFRGCGKRNPMNKCLDVLCCEGDDDDNGEVPAHSGSAAAPQGPGSAKDVFLGIFAHCIPDTLAMAGICASLAEGHSAIGPAAGYMIEMGILNFDEALNALGSSEHALRDPWLWATVVVPGLTMGVGPTLTLALLDTVRNAGETGEQWADILNLALQCLAAILWFRTWYQNAAEWFHKQGRPGSARATVHDLMVQEGARDDAECADGPNSNGRSPVFDDLAPHSIGSRASQSEARARKTQESGSLRPACVQNDRAAQLELKLRVQRESGKTFVQWVVVGLLVTVVLNFLKPTIETWSAGDTVRFEFRVAPDASESWEVPREAIESKRDVPGLVSAVMASWFRSEGSDGFDILRTVLAENGLLLEANISHLDGISDTGGAERERFSAPSGEVSVSRIAVRVSHCSKAAAEGVACAKCAYFFQLTTGGLCKAQNCDSQGAQANGECTACAEGFEPNGGSCSASNCEDIVDMTGACNKCNDGSTGPICPLATQ